MRTSLARTFLGFFSVFFVSLHLSAGLNEDFEALRNSGKHYEIIGTICEEVARLRLAEQYRAPEYKVVTGIAYGDSSRTIGELDVIVFNTKERVAVKLAEVKCWKNMQGGLNKARDQRSRFKNAVAKRSDLYFQSTGDKTRYNQNQFQEVREFVAIAQKGSKAVGYEQELPYTLEELMGLRAKMMECQQQGLCARP